MQRAMHHPRHRNHCGVIEVGAPRPRTAPSPRQQIDTGIRRDAQGWDVMPQHGRTRLLRGRAAGWGRIQPTPRGAAAAAQPIRNQSTDWGWRHGKPISHCRRRADGWGLSAAAERPRAAHQSHAAAGRWEHYKDHWAAPDLIGAPIPATTCSCQPGARNTQLCFNAAAATLQLQASQNSGHKGMRAAWLFLPFTWVLVQLCSAPGCGRAYSTTLPSEKAAARRPSRLICGCCGTGTGSQPTPGF